MNLNIIIAYCGYGFAICCTVLLCRLFFDIVVSAFRRGR